VRLRRSVLLRTPRASGAHATDHLRVIESVRRAALLHVRGQPRKEGVAELEPPARLFGARAGSRRPLFGETTRFRRRCAPSGVRHDAVGSPLGADPLASHSGLMWDEAEMLPSGTHRSRTRRDSILSSERSERHGAHRPSGWKRPSPRAKSFGTWQAPTQEPDKAETPCLPRLFGSGTPKRLEPRGETSSTERSGRRETRGSIEEACRSKAHGSIERCEAERLRGRNGLLGGTPP